MTVVNIAAARAARDRPRPVPRQQYTSLSSADRAILMRIGMTQSEAERLWSHLAEIRAQVQRIDALDAQQTTRIEALGRGIAQARHEMAQSKHRDDALLAELRNLRDALVQHQIDSAKQFTQLALRAGGGTVAAGGALVAIWQIIQAFTAS